MRKKTTGVSSGLAKLTACFVANALLLLAQLRVEFKKVSSCLVSSRGVKRVGEIVSRHKAMCDNLIRRGGSRIRIARVVGKAYTYRKICHLMSPLWQLYENTMRNQEYRSWRQAVTDFILGDGISTQLPDAKTAGVFFLNCSLKETYSKFVQMTGRKIHFSTFCKLRPTNVRLVDDIPNCMSVCPSCENVRLKALAISALGVVGCPPTATSALKQLWCPHETFPPLKCAQNNCYDCRLRRIQLQRSLLKSLGKRGDSLVTYHWWESKDREIVRKRSKPGEPTTKVVRRTQRFSESVSLKHLIDMYLDAVIAQSLHVFIAGWQWGQYKQIKQNLRPSTLVTVCDFAMNYLNTFQDEPAEAHWDHEQTMIFPVVNWYRCGTLNCPHVVTHEQIFVVPNQQEHNYYAVAAFETESLKDLKDRFCIPITDIINWSDNCGQQFKSKGPFFWLLGKRIPSTLAFLGERHGKNDTDGVTGQTK